MSTEEGAAAPGGPASAASAAENDATTPSKVVVVFDYDWSLVNENSDTYLFKTLAPEVYAWLKERARENPGDWTATVDASLLKMQDSGAAELGGIQTCLENIPVLDEMLDAVRETAASDAGALHIVSDANDFFIRVFLEKHGLATMVDSVHTNKSFTDDEGYLRVAPYVSAEDPHTCELCPKNLCKGLVIDKLGILTPDVRVLYVGDGGGDFCPGLRLRPQDWLLVRSDESYPSALGLSKRIKAHQDERPVLARVRPWTQGSEVAQLVREALALARRARV
ncbi:Thiamine phosphate phosphatase-like protein [Hondaea fermentalgiana]|uniref:Thiamine phosphate phosphatase-like protein n=1 Tax=Hondaea fermentalgiana TaxID=2315210 RepID=A0A2R5G7C5_9STRA|nr:Thiamine phosphate phosphatase-like protein [Hondaea fermentalgiana]|eukprot:GBG26229.1 Thiamine phosphate phosphatase-like protein [Hondaea fermentalgiana]